MYDLSPPSSFLLAIVACFWRIFQLPFSPIAAMFLEKFLASLLTCCCMFFGEFFGFPSHPFSACFWRNFQLPLSTIAATVIH
jgi:hypothetical protein